MIALVGNKLDLVADSDAKQTSQDSNAEDDEDDENDTVTDAQNVSGTSLRAVPTEEAKAYADDAGLLFFETSAKTGEGIVELFTEIAKKIPIDQIVASQQRTASSGNNSSAGQRNPGPGGNRVDLNAQGGSNRDACNC